MTTASPRPSTACAACSRFGTPPHLQRHIAVLADVSQVPEADTPGTLYMTWLFKPDSPDEVVEDIYMHTLTLAFFAAIQRTPRARVIWPTDDEIAVRACRG